MDASAFALLPAEIRIYIWELALIEASPIRIEYKKELTGNGLAQLTRPHLCALLLTCKQVRDEALPVFYATNVFEICVPSVSDYCAHDAFLQRCRNPLWYAILSVQRFLCSLHGAHKPPNLSIVVDFGSYNLSHAARLGDVKWLFFNSARQVKQHLTGLCLLKLTAVYLAGEPSSVESFEVVFDPDNIPDSFEAISKDLKERAGMPGVNPEQIDRLRGCFQGWWVPVTGDPMERDSKKVFLW